MRTISFLLLSLCFGAGLPQSARASLLEHSFSAAYYFSDTSTPYALSAFMPQAFTVGPGIETIGEVEGATSLFTDLSHDSLAITFHSVLSNPTWAMAPFNGVIFTLTSGSALNIASAAVNDASTFAVFDAARVSFNDHQIALNWSGLSYLDGQKLIIDFGFAEANPFESPVPPLAVPELGMLTIAGAGVLMGWTRLRRRFVV